MTHGRDQLRDWMERREFNQREAAKYLGFDETMMSSFLSGRRQPGLPNAILIERKTGIPVEAWLSSALGESVASNSDTASNTNLDKV